MNDSNTHRRRVHAELAHASARRSEHDLDAAWRHLERAHILSQPDAWPHVRVHAAMLALAARTGDLREVAGQIARLVVAAPGSATGRYPKGNTGRARVSMFATMAAPPDLRDE